MKQKITLAILLFVLAMTIFNGCKKESSPTSTEDKTTDNSNSASGQPVPSFGSVSNYGGVMATIKFGYSYPGVPAIDFAMGFASFGQNGIDAGDVSVNSNTLTKQTSGNSVSYNSFSQTNPSSLTNVNFNGSTHQWQVTGSAAVPSFTASVVSPSDFSITAPTANGTAAKSGFSIQWNNTSSTADSVMVVVAGTGGSIIKQGLKNGDTKVTLSSTDLASISGQTTIQVVKYRYSITTKNNSAYVAVAEIVKSITVTLQ